MITTAFYLDEDDQTVCMNYGDSDAGITIGYVLLVILFSQKRWLHRCQRNEYVEGMPCERECFGVWQVLLRV